MITSAAVNRLTARLRLTTPLIGVYDAPPSSAFAPLVESEGTTCCFAHYSRWVAGETLVVSRGGAGCQGAQRALGSVTFFVDPDRLGAVMTLACYWTADNVVSAPFGSGCSLLWRSLEEDGKDRAVLGATDIAMRRHLPPDILSLPVTPQRFEQMLSFPDDAFLNRSWWNGLMDEREQARR